ncbi:MAG: XRE family transcriptional regulator [Planctomycetes bacterium]|nr:XRE family transcriptional regulator [Planctomycetota bacterium]
METLVEQERLNAAVAQQLYDLRLQASLTQKELADLVGTTASVICRLEDADYEGHSLSMLRRIAGALNSRIEVRFIPIEKSASRNAGSKMAGQGKVVGRRKPSG